MKNSNLFNLFSVINYVALKTDSDEMAGRISLGRDKEEAQRFAAFLVYHQMLKPCYLEEIHDSDHLLEYLCESNCNLLIDCIEEQKDGFTLCKAIARAVEYGFHSSAAKWILSQNTNTRSFIFKSHGIYGEFSETTDKNFKDLIYCLLELQPGLVAIKIEE